MAKKNTTVIQPSTQEYIDIEDIRNDIAILKDGSAVLILEVTAINFGLFSEREQEATIYAYAQLLNSLTFSIQIVIASKRKDITDYLVYVDNQLARTTSPEIQVQMRKYRDFVTSIVRQGNVLDKKFYIAIPFSSLELGISSSMTSLFRPRRKPAMPIENIVERATTNLIPKRDHLIRLLARIGLRSHQLTSLELLQLFFELYNRELVGNKVYFPINHPEKARLDANPDQ